MPSEKKYNRNEAAPKGAKSKQDFRKNEFRGKDPDYRSGRNTRRTGTQLKTEKRSFPAPQRTSYRQFEFDAEMDTKRQNVKETSDDIYILTGRNPIREALKNNRDLEKLMVQKGDLSGSAMEIVKTAKDRKILVQVVEKSRLDEIAPNHQGLIAFASAYSYSTVEDILQAAAEKNEDPFLVLLDGITDPHNLGAIIRAVEYLTVARVTNLNRTIEELQKRNIWVYALTMNGKDYESVSFSGGTAIVIGAEGEGISKLTEEKCDLAVSLPMKGHLDSLNASVAAGVIMYRIMSSRKAGISD